VAVVFSSAEGMPSALGSREAYMDVKNEEMKKSDADGRPSSSGGTAAWAYETYIARTTNER
jgi:hypothetical protein